MTNFQLNKKKERLAILKQRIEAVKVASEASLTAFMALEFGLSRQLARDYLDTLVNSGSVGVNAEGEICALPHEQEQEGK